MVDPIVERLRDALPVNPPYTGVVAAGYDAWIPVDTPLEDEVVHRRVAERAGGPVLELGCGTGRPLLRWLADGIEVEGVDASADMLAILRRHAAERGLRPVVHQGEMAPLSLGRTYAAIVCPSGTFTLVDDDDRARDALVSYRRHLRPGGMLAITLYVPHDDEGEAMGWRVRRTGTLADGTTVVVHEAVRCDVAARLRVAYNRVETYDADGVLRETRLRRQHLRWWPRPEFDAMLADAGFVDVRSHGDDTAWVATARAPGATAH
ncbi:MAG TPA: class I SAM-dependent methyltransferase [Acidimicrobiales bacterium]